jgi:hypothetical protein
MVHEPKKMIKMIFFFYLIYHTVIKIKLSSVTDGTLFNMARKDSNGVKHNKKNNSKESRKRGPYSQKCARIKEAIANDIKTSKASKASKASKVSQVI